MAVTACRSEGDDSDDDQPDDDDDARLGDHDNVESSEPLERCFFYRDEDWEEPAALKNSEHAQPASRFGIAAARELTGLTDQAVALIMEPGLPSLEKHRRLQRLAAGQLPLLRKRLALIERGLKQDNTLSFEQHQNDLLSLLLARHMLSRLEHGLQYRVPDLPPSAPLAADGMQIELDDAVLERYWRFYHWTEILGAYNDDSQYSHLLEGTGRSDFIDSEIGRTGIEMQMDEWRVSPAIWNDTGLTPEQKLMSAKYSMWQNPDWGGGDHYVNEHWSWEPGFVDEDCPLFTGNALAALAAEYGATRNPRTLRRLRDMVDALLYFDELTVEGQDPLDTGPRDGRLQRGPKMKNLYYEDEENLFSVTVDEQGIHFNHNNSVADRNTGRERKNVSRDQYYGLLTGYYTLYSVFNSLDALDGDEEELLCDVVLHMERIVGYLKGPRFNPDHGPAYNLYVLVEGSCANPPNLSFMGLMAADWFEEVAGIELPYWQAGDELFGALLDLGALIGTVEISQQLFEPAHSGLTALNQYLAALLMSDQPRAHWEFIFPGELLRDASQGRRNLWRRLIAAYAFKFGDLGNADYQGVIQEMLDPAFNPPLAIDDLSSGTTHGYVNVRPSGWGIEDLMWPLMFVVYASEDRTELGERLNQGYAELVADGTLSFEHTDIEPAR